MTSYPGEGCLSGAAWGSACWGVVAAVLSVVELSSWAARKTSLSETRKVCFYAMKEHKYRATVPSSDDSDNDSLFAAPLTEKWAQFIDF